MLEMLRQLDVALLLAINGLHCEWLDFAMYHLSGRWQWIPLYLLLVYLLARRLGVRRFIWFIILGGLLVLACDQICGAWLRGWIARPRPSSADSGVCHLLHFVNDYRGGHYGFPSCHAANSMAATVFICMAAGFKKYYPVLLWPLLVAYSRIYLGVHYPSDILAGWAIGLSFALLFSKVYALTLHPRIRLRLLSLIPPLPRK